LGWNKILIFKGVNLKNQIIVLSFLLSFNAFAQVQLEPTWKTKGRDLISSLIGEKWGVQFFGPIPVPPEKELKLPAIPKELKKATDVESYTKLQKDPTEYDRLPDERKRQYNLKFLQEIIFVTRKMDASEDDLASWLNTLDQGGSREGVYQALVLDEVYASLENKEEKSNERLLDFTLKFSQRFLNQTFKKESISSLNLYSIKRIMTEKSLDLLEHYEVKNLDDLNQWYAIFSFELAKDYGPLLKTPLRQDQRFEYHLHWAKNMPIQHIKSEFIIKLHSVMNGLQLLE
jgi:hypothetical protein